MQSAVKWLAEQLYPAIKLNSKYIDEFIEQANKMFEQQIIDAWNNGDTSVYRESAKQYYNETFKK